jgi:hypothetical protein
MAAIVKVIPITELVNFTSYSSLYTIEFSASAAKIIAPIHVVLIGL